MRIEVCVFALTALAGGSVAHASAEAVQEAAAPATPREITISTTPIGPVFADPDAYTLYVTRRDTEPSVSTCFEACATEWPPVRASADAEPFGDWSLVERADGVPQWAYKGRPLYRYRWEEDTNWAIGQGDLWQIATVDPFPDRERRRRRSYLRSRARQTRFPVKAAPAGIVGETTPLGVVLADAEGLALYVAPAGCESRCDAMWAPLRAPAAAVAIGDWSVVPRDDGLPQWTFQGQPLYRCLKDVAQGEATCVPDGGQIVEVPSTLIIREGDGG